MRHVLTRVRTPVLVGLALVLSSLPSEAQEASLAVVLGRATEYVDRLYEQLSGMVSEEQYEQRSRATSGRGARNLRAQRVTLRSDYLLVRPNGSDRYYGFRDVFEVDGRPVRDREERLTQLFLDTSASAQRQIQGILDDSARYNVGDVARNINTPTLALLFLRQDYRPRFTFERVSDTSPPLGLDLPDGAADVWVIEFEETGPTTVVGGGDGRNLPAHGRYWIEPATGRVLVSELAFEDFEINSLTVVSYDVDETMGHAVPVEMRELLGNRRRGSRIDGTATYTRFRKFQVQVEDRPPSARARDPVRRQPRPRPARPRDATAPRG